MEKFCETLKKTRRRSHQTAADFAKYANLRPRTYYSYESGGRIPPEPVLEAIINKTSLTSMEAEKLRSLHRLAMAERPDVDMSMFEHLVDVSGLAERIAKEIGFELKRYNITVTPRIQRVCERRISMILDDALRRK